MDRIRLNASEWMDFRSGEKKCFLLTNSGDWTQNCNSKNVDTTKFVNMMQAVKAGKQIDWICPFCSGTVERLEQKGGKTVIGCTSCDMRIQIEN